MIFESGNVLIFLLPGILVLPLLCSGQDFNGTNLSREVQPYGRPPFKYENNKMLSITFKTSPEIIKTLVPAPLIPNSSGEIEVYIGLLNVTEPSPTSYYEAAIRIPVSFADQKGYYMAVLYLDKAMPIVAGREIYGYPKVDAEIKIEREKGKMRATVVKAGVTIIDATMSLGEPIQPIPILPNIPMFAIKSIPSVKKDALPDVKQLVSITLENPKTTELRLGQATLKFVTSATDPLSSIPINSILRAAYVETDFVLGYGEVLHDYLHEENAKTRSP